MMTRPEPPVTLLTPILAFLRSERAGGVMLILSGIVALIWANSPLRPEYEAVLHWVPVMAVPLSLHVWVNDGLMAVFFLSVGLELRREMTTGALASPRRLAAPGFAALGGMVVPALVFVAFNRGDAVALRGWAVPMATDIAFALAVAGALGRRVPMALKVFLTALAIIDDLGAIVVIALFYSRGIDAWGVGGALLVLTVLYGLRRVGVRFVAPYVVGGAVLWALVFRSGVHATLAGVALAFVVPRDVGARLERAAGPWVAYGVLPVFGLVNAGLAFDALPSGVWTERLTIGIVLGLLVGKPLGVFGAVMLATRAGLARLPKGLTVTQMFGASVLCGIGFTMSLFIGDLAFRGLALVDAVKLAVFVGSLISAVLGLGVLGLARGRPLVRED